MLKDNNWLISPSKLGQIFYLVSSVFFYSMISFTIRTMNTSLFAGSGKPEGNILEKWELKTVARLYTYIPSWLETYHLTLLTFLWSGLVILFLHLSKTDTVWLIAASLMIFVQYITDYLDGIVGRSRETGLVRWGFYMDHLLDFVFMASIFIGYFFLFPTSALPYLAFIFIVTATFMTNTFLLFAVKHTFQHNYWRIGPTELRLMAIGFNMLIWLGGVGTVAAYLPVLTIFFPLPLIVSVYTHQRQLWREDMETKNKHRLRIN